MKKVLVAGTTGYLGKYVVQEFKKQGYWTRALARNTAMIESLSEYIDEKFIGKVTDPNSLTGICKDIDIVFSSIGITKQKDGLTYMDVDYQGNLNLLEEAKKEGISKFIYVSVFNAEKMSHLKGIHAKVRFEDELKKSRLNFSIIYPNGFFSDMLEYLQMAKKGRGYVFGSGENKINPIHGEDLAEVCANAVKDDESEIKVGGVDLLTHNEILTTAFESLGKKVKIIKIPIWIRNLFLATLRIFTSVKTYGPLEFFMTVLAMDMIAPTYGKHHLKDFFFENINID
ncbi:MAG: SDR family oxidoreductase [Ignavibacteria bacterium]|nr:SDR family oxidoreductase [Ignavibacteria bacterium]MBT8382792.1 SDR family oxidoreductase [Ignavibacteria bacterium]MBT8392679.1 SDR family oxidoreductase [Ignavibacteria bacterium]NNJ52541.1 SDR family oxidoreductase [Ignavibacteriaceae bacterium]NNL21986.1 SDR family oxidoreductase [Ignavibacteriaceae bacterium]